MCFSLNSQKKIRETSNFIYYKTMVFQNLNNIFISSHQKYLLLNNILNYNIIIHGVTIKTLTH